jgi:tetratricopeptide (TPR) repeat protein
MRQQSGDLVPAAEEITNGIRLLQQLSAGRPNERETLGNIASSQARLGAIQAELGRRQDALDSYKAGASQLEETLRRFPNNAQSQHELMLAYSHIGDTLGNPAYDNFGDAQGAREAYGKMAHIAKSLSGADPADFRAMSDYGIALLRVGIVTAPEQKRSALEKAYDLLGTASARNPKDRGTQIHKMWTEVELGDAAMAASDRGTAVRYYRAAIATAESGQPIDVSDSSSQRWVILASRKIAEERVRAGDREGALAVLDKALQLAKRIDGEVPPTSVTIRSGLARAWQAAGFVYGKLAEMDRGELRTQDHAAALDWYRRSMAEWRRLEPLQGFTEARRKEMNSAVAELAALEGRSGGRQ